jgi:hypothetical protein
MPEFVGKIGVVDSRGAFATVGSEGSKISLWVLFESFQRHVANSLTHLPSQESAFGPRVHLDAPEQILQCTRRNDRRSI